MSFEKNISEQELKPEVDRLFAELIEKKEVKEALNLLNQLPEHLKYHNKDHTLDVIRETILFCLADNASAEIIEQQVIAAAWHDVGYLVRYEKNEPEAVGMFEKSKSFQTLSEDQKSEIKANILDTQLIMKDDEPFLLQTRSKLGYVLDADVSNFGRADFLEKRLKVAEELNINLLDREIKRLFYAFAIRLLKNHEWKTQSARTLRQAQKVINLENLEREFSNI